MNHVKPAVHTRKMVVTAMLAAITIVLGTTPLGFIPIGPTKATIMHVPVIIGAIIEGPAVGLALGFIFGVFSMIQAVIAPTIVSFVFLDPLVAILPRLLIGLSAYYVYKATKSSLASAAVATLTNTIGVLGMVYILHGVQFVEALGADKATVGRVIAGIGVANGIPEAIVASVVVGAAVGAIKKIRN